MNKRRPFHKGLAALFAALLALLMVPSSAFAATLDRTGFAGVPADTVRIDYPLSVSDASFSTTNSGFRVVHSDNIWDASGDTVVYNGPAMSGTVSGSFTLTWQNAGTDSSGDSIDLVVTVSNVYIRTTATNITLIDDINSLTLDAIGSGIRMDVSVRVTKHGTSSPASGTLLVSFTDIDVVQSSSYSEQVELLSGFGSTVWVPTTNFLDIDSSATRFTATRADQNTYDSGMVTTASTSGFTLRWQGDGCGTNLLVPFNVNSQSVTASAGSHGSITDPGTTYLRWKNDKTYTITPSNGYHVSNVVVDGSSVGTPTSYTFREVTGNHTISASFAPNTYTIQFAGNGTNVSGSTASMSMTYDTARNLTANGFSRPGYTFTGWNTSPSGSGTSYSNGQSVSNLTSTNGGVVTLYAQWREDPPVDITYQVSDTEHASVSRGSESVAPATGEATGSTVTVDEGYRLVNWTDADGNIVGSAGQFVPSRGTDGLWHAGSYTANIEPIRYVIAFDANGGEGLMNPMRMTYDVSDNLTGNRFTRTGYLFQGWATTRDGEVVFADTEEVLNLTAEHGGVVTLYAVWEPITYTVVFEPGADGVTGSTDSMTMTYDEWDTLSKNGFEWEGHRFNAWTYVDANGQRHAYADGAGVRNLTSTDGDTITLTAQWTVLSNRVRFLDWNKGVLGSELVEWDEDATAPEDPARTGYTFTGWDRDYTHVKEPLDVTAQYRPNAYEVAFDANGGSGSMDDQAMTYDVADNLTGNAFTRTGYTFQGWATEPDGPIVYQDQHRVVNLTAEDGGTVTLYAVWDENAPVAVSYAVSDPEHCTVSLDREELAPATGEAAGSTVSVDEGYRFTGWTDSEGNEVGEDLTYMPSRGVSGLWEPETYTANIEPISYEVAFDANGGEGSMNDQAMTYDVAASLTESVFTRTGYTFCGWATEPDGEVAYADMDTVVNLTSEDGGTVTLYAVWAENDPATITYVVSDPEHGTLSSEGESVAPATGEVAGSTVTPDEGYRLVSWLDEKGNEIGSNLTYMPSRGESGLWEDAIYTAQIAPIRYQIAFDANGGSGSMDNQAMTYDVPADLNRNAFLRTGYTFCGWATEPDGEAVFADAEEVVNLTTEDGGTVTLYAVWAEGDSVDITYQVSDPEHGSVSSGSESLSPVSGEAAGSTVTPDEGYRFTGWTDQQGNEVGSDLTFVPSRGESGLWEPGTYTAQVVPVGYEVAFDANGGEGSMDNMRMTYDVADNLTVNSFSRLGYTFRGWATEPGGGVVYQDRAEVVNLTAEDGGTVTLYAVWVPRILTVTFVMPDGTLIDVQRVTYGEDATAPDDPSMGEHEFTGWDRDFTGVTEDLTVTATFEGVEKQTFGRPSGWTQTYQTATGIATRSTAQGGFYGKTGADDSVVTGGIVALAATAAAFTVYGMRLRRRAKNEEEA